MISARYVSIHPMRQMISKFGASKTTLGIVIDASMNASTAPRPGKRYLAIAYPPMEQKNTETTVAVDARNSELNRYRQNCTGPLMLCVGLNNSRKLSRFTVLVEISR